MPCDTKRTITTQLEAAHPEVLARALRAAGFDFQLQADGRTINIQRNGRTVATLAGKELSGTSEDVLSAIKKAYATEAIQTAARRNGFTVRAGAEQGELRLTRRSL